jgi:hypothetical protein
MSAVAMAYVLLLRLNAGWFPGEDPLEEDFVPVAQYKNTEIWQILLNSKILYPNSTVKIMGPEFYCPRMQSGADFGQARTGKWLLGL